MESNPVRNSSADIVRRNVNRSVTGAAPPESIASKGDKPDASGGSICLVIASIFLKVAKFGVSVSDRSRAPGGHSAGSVPLLHSRRDVTTQPFNRASALSNSKLTRMSDVAEVVLA